MGNHNIELRRILRHELAKAINNYRHQNKIKAEEIAPLCGVPAKKICRIERTGYGNWNEFKNIIKTLNVEIHIRVKRME